MQSNERRLAKAGRSVDSVQLGEAAHLTRAFMAVSETVFDRIWSNPEDEVYESLCVQTKKS